MWREYGNSSEAVAIETAVGRLRSALGPAFLIIPVTYLDFSKDSLPKEHSLQPYFFKRGHFAWEREVRIIGEMEIGKRMGTPRLVRIDLEGIVQRVIVSPYAAPEYLETVRGMLREASLSIDVHTSAIKNAA
jgi:hypothetical protein